MSCNRAVSAILKVLVKTLFSESEQIILKGALLNGFIMYCCLNVHVF